MTIVRIEDAAGKLQKQIRKEGGGRLGSYTEIVTERIE